MELGSESSLAVPKGLFCWNLASQNSSKGLFQKPLPWTWGSPGGLLLLNPSSCQTPSQLQPGTPRPSPGRFYGKGCHLVAKSQTYHLPGGCDGLGRGSFGTQVKSVSGKRPPSGACFSRLPHSWSANSGPQREGSGSPRASEQKAGLACGTGSEVSWRVLTGAHGRSPEGKPQLALSLNPPPKVLVLPQMGRGEEATLGL